MTLIDFIQNLVTDPFFIISASFWIIAYVILKIIGKKKDNVLMFFPIYAMFRTRKLNNWLQKVGRKYKKFWKIWFSIGIFVSLGFMVYGVYFFIQNIFELLIAPKPENAIQPLIPGVTIELSFFSYLILPLLFIITFHEFSHAMASEADGLPIKSTGIIGAGLFYIIFPGAFVEADDFRVNSRKTSPWTRLRIFGAGTFTNAIQAGICLLLFVNFPAIISPCYGPQVFQVDYVLGANEGGFNDGNLLIGDKVIDINGTKIDVSENIGLTQVLSNQTELKISVGDSLNLTVLDNDNNLQYRTLTLGDHFFLGFSYTYASNTELEITTVYDIYQGGNNYDVLEDGMKFISIDGYSFDIASNQTLGRYLIDQAVEGKVNMTTSEGVNISIHIDYWPEVLGAFAFRDFFIGAFFENDSNGNVYVERVLSDLTETGINDDNLFNDDQITHVNGVQVEINSETTFEEFLTSVVGTVSEETEVIFTILPKNDNDSVNRSVIVTPVPKSYVFIGVQTSSYWIPKNWFGELLGSNFAIWLEKELYYFFMVGFSVTLFNMLPMIFPPLDGYQMLKEFIGMIIGSDFKNKRKKKVKFYYESETCEYNLNTYDITQLESIEMELPDGVDPNTIDELKYEFIDTIDDGYADTLRFDSENRTMPPENTILSANLEVLTDNKVKPKKLISSSIGIIGLSIVVLNFLFSYLFVGDITFWI